MTIPALARLSLLIATLLGRGTPSPHVQNAIATACAEEAAAHPVDARACVALVTTYASHESSFRADAIGDGGRSYGLLQEPIAIARRLDALGQVRYWLDLLHRGSLAGLSGHGLGGRRIAAHRQALAASLLQRVDASEGVAERRP